MLTRRSLVQGVAAAAAMSPLMALASADTDRRLVLVILRGAMDGLAMLPPIGDGNYAKLRGELALPGPGNPGGALKLDGLFGLHPSLSGVHGHFEQQEALFIHAIASPYRARSHFDGQDVLENGVTTAGGRRDGWLNRAIEPLGGSLGQEAAIALAQNTPLVLRGDNSVTSWAPSQLPEADDATLARLARLYADDEFFSTRLAQAIDSQNIAGDMGNDRSRKRRGNEAARLKASLQQAGKFLRADGGPRIAVVESGGWDTHANQGASTGSLANKFAALDQGLVALHSELGPAWSDSVVLVVTEFGRTAAVNGTRGTDHGTASAAMLLGGAVAGGRITADWPGLATKDLYQGRDLQPTTDMRGLFKAVLIDHLAVAEGFVEETVFPDSLSQPPLDGLLRS